MMPVDTLGAQVLMQKAAPKPMHRCPVAAFQKMISGKYKLRLLWDLQDGPRRYGELKSGLLRGTEETKEIAPRVLSRELKALAASGLIARRDYGVVPRKWNIG
jgi:DNA-binding HxlR family transcriptional regulator